MSHDEQAIRDLIATWHSATARGDVSQLLTLMAEDVVSICSGMLASIVGVVITLRTNKPVSRSKKHRLLDWISVALQPGIQQKNAFSLGDKSEIYAD